MSAADNAAEAARHVHGATIAWGADAYLDKPFDLDDLSDRIEELVGVRPQG